MPSQGGYESAWGSCKLAQGSRTRTRRRNSSSIPLDRSSGMFTSKHLSYLHTLVLVSTLRWCERKPWPVTSLSELPSEPTFDDDHDSAYGDDIECTASLSASFLQYRTLHGRTFHSDMGKAESWYPTYCLTLSSKPECLTFDIQGPKRRETTGIDGYTVSSDKDQTTLSRWS